MSFRKVNNRTYNNHDNRTVSFDSHRGRGTSFKQRYQNSSKTRQTNVRARAVDGDVDMNANDGSSAESSNQRFAPYGARRGNVYRRVNNRGGRGRNRNFDPSQLAHAAHNNNRLGPSDWYKITIIHGKKTEKSVVLKSLNGLMSNVPFVPFHYQFEGQNAVFFLNDQSTAVAVRDCSKKITASNGFKLMILAKASQSPYVQIDEEVIEKLKVIMSSRYDPATKTLDMSALYADASLKQQGMHLAMNKYSVVKEVLNIIEKYIPEVEALDISSNALFTLDSMKRLPQVAKSLTKVSVGKNQIKSEHDLDALKKLQVEHLVLDGNPLCDKFKDGVKYVSALRKKFPKLATLDGHVLPPEIKIDLESGSIPPTQGSNFVNPQVQSIVCAFCKEYFTVYDTPDRQPLLNAYHDQAKFTYSYHFNGVINESRDRDTYQPNFKEYTDSRNLLKVYSDRRQKGLKQGKLSVVAALNELPATRHDTTSFLLDVSHISTTMLVFTVTGLFEERDSKSNRKPIRYFSRTFVAVPQGTGIVITNDNYIVTNASAAQQKKAFTTAEPVAPLMSTPVASPSASNAVSPVVSPQGVASVPNDQIKLQMVTQFSEKSGMNLDFSRQCLQENLWNFNKAAAVFTDLKAQGKLPPQAFVK